MDLSHEPALKADGTVYRPYALDDSGLLQGYQTLVCRLCHVYYADPDTAPAVDKWAQHRHEHVELPWPADLLGEPGGVCPAKLHQLLRRTLL